MSDSRSAPLNPELITNTMNELPRQIGIDELAREITALEPGDPRRAQIVYEITRLNDVLKQTGD
jgi:hypothetical protein